MQFFRLLAFLSVFLLSGCGAYGPFFNCRTGCSNPNEIRDMFCACQAKSTINIPPAPNSPGDPYLFRQSVAGGCTSFQEEDFIFNPQPREIDVLIGFKVPDSTPTGTWDEAWYTVSANAVTNSTSLDLGLKYVAPNCFDKDFFLKTWQFHTSGAVRLLASRMSIMPAGPAASLTEALASLDPNSRERAELSIAHHKDVRTQAITAAAVLADNAPASKIGEITTENKVVRRLDCSKLCHAGDFRCFANRPPDGQKIGALRDRILATKANSNLPTTDILKIFGLGSDTCGRGITTVDQTSHVQNDGEICAYPILLKATDTTPVAAVHIGHNVNGEAISGAGGTSVIFDKPNALPTLSFSQGILQGDFGGKVLEMSADQAAVYMNTPSGCVSLQVSP